MIKNPIIIDTDPGIDDALAIVLALKQKDLNVVLLSSVRGNVGIEKTTSNLIKIKEFMDSDIPISQGASEPLSLRKIHAKNVHGTSGMDGYDFRKPKTKLLEISSYEAMHQIINASSSKPLIIALAPLTNIALLFRHYPSDRNKIAGIVMMGGTLKEGNITKDAEYNIYGDVVAFEEVLKAGVHFTLIPLEVTHKALMHKKSVQMLKGYGKVGYMLASLLEAYKGGSLEEGLRIHDALAVSYVLKPDLFKTKELLLAVNSEGKLIENKDGHCVHFAWDIEAMHFEQWLMERLK